MDDPDFVVVGGGVAGGAFATVMARAGFSVVMLEITREHRDVVRGEYMASWGVIDAQKLGLYDLYMQGGGHHPMRLALYDEDVDPAAADAMAIDFNVLPLPPPIAMGHPRLCCLLDDAAEAAGVRFLRGVRHTRVTPGSPPVVTFEHEGSHHELKPRLVVGADGRHGQTRRQIGIQEEADPVHHWMTGLLVEGIEGWPEDLSCIGVEGWRNYFVFPQGGGRARLYLCFDLNDRDRFMGPDGARSFLDAFRLSSATAAGALAAARPASDLFGYPNNDTWVDEPFAEGVVLIGDAAGHNDPIIGQGLSIAQRDVRMVSEILISGSDWSTAALRPYAEERAERMRRLRNVSRMVSVRDAEFTDEARERRRRIGQRLQLHPELIPTIQVPTIGPDALPAEAYSEATMAAILA